MITLNDMINDEHVVAIHATDEVNSDGQIETYYIISTNTKEYLYTSFGEMLDSWNRVIEKRKEGGKLKIIKK